jgi:hypothetical protein
MMFSVRPPTTSDAVRGFPVVLRATVKVTDPLPEPLPPVTVTQEALPLVLQAHPACVWIGAARDAPAAGTVNDVCGTV